MYLRLPLLVATLALLAWPVGAQTTFENEEQPFFIGRVNNSPVPSRKSDPPPEAPEVSPETGGGTDDAPLTADPPETNRVTITTRPATPLDDRGADGARETVGEGSEPAARPANETPPANGDTIETRPLPVVLRPRTTPETDPDKSDRTKRAPDPDETRDERFVRAPEDKTFEPEEKGTLGAPIPAPETNLQPGATLRQLDKMTGRIVTFDIAVGQTLQVARLLVKLDACRAPNDNDTHGTMAHLKIWDTKTPDEDASFAGWMFAESPALSALDHPRYDLWVINCTTVSAGISAANE